MNKVNAKDYLPLVQALADGKTIEHRSSIGDWHSLENVTLLDKPESYRIKPEPRIFKLMIHKYTGVIEDNDFISYDPDIWEPITVQEVI